MIESFEAELVFGAVDDRFDLLPDPADRRVGPVGLVGAAGTQQQRRQLADGGFEVAPAKPLSQTIVAASIGLASSNASAASRSPLLAATRSKSTIVPSASQSSTSLKPQ
jgi:hypothetical protein